MLKSLYSYEGVHERTLCFEKNEIFLEIGVSKDPSWIHVVNDKGQLGYIPKNYIAIDESSPADMVRLIDDRIDKIHQISNRENAGSYSRIQHETLCTLNEHRRLWKAKIPPPVQPSKRPAPLPPKMASCHELKSLVAKNLEQTSLPVSSSMHSNLSEPSKSGDNYNQNGEREESSNSVFRHDTSLSDCSGPSYVTNGTASSEQKSQISVDTKLLSTLVPANYYKQLIDSVRSSTKISISTSHQVVSLVLESLGSTLGPLRGLFEEILQQREMEGAVHTPNGSNNWDWSSDGRTLVQLLEKIRECKDDGQQRSWALYEDAFTIKELLQDILDIITNGDGSVCNIVFSLDDFRPLNTLVQFYQMETRWSLRKVLLQIFTGVCHLSPENISFLSASVLPLEFTREILDSKTSDDELQYIALVFGMVLSMGDTIPVMHFAIMNEIFVQKLFDLIEFYCENTETEDIGDIVLTLLLAFNLQFHHGASSGTSEGSPGATSPGALSVPTEHLVMKMLSQQSHAKHFFEKLLILFNREDDPVRMFDHTPTPPNSVISIIGHIYRDENTAKLLYTNDEKVLCDIVLRQITDLSPEDKRRSEYLELLEGVVTLGRWEEHHHRQREFESRVSSILSKEETSKQDEELLRRIIRKIS